MHDLVVETLLSLCVSFQLFNTLSVGAVELREEIVLELVDCQQGAESVEEKVQDGCESSNSAGDANVEA